ncbi:uncharacterized protein BCR38DRAFT_436135 [Pseudomassariella vexata]|uniref:Uncharacterized protein n=1 Tax=Pseudomassariella vexata TaxID=1141098 RepID=A0A1Y2DV76_9PEZI|nr:uncharacterized protein BCR38DRAFT_436135 [Pseudomassariella vexata]ORY63190.1 hypothetical protein BCR38DRAFT_436135 [Pseudomassariella vexata]
MSLVALGFVYAMGCFSSLNPSDNLARRLQPYACGLCSYYPLPIFLVPGGKLIPFQQVLPWILLQYQDNYVLNSGRGRGTSHPLQQELLGEASSAYRYVDLYLLGS